MSYSAVICLRAFIRIAARRPETYRVAPVTAGMPSRSAAHGNGPTTQFHDDAVVASSHSQDYHQRNRIASRPVPAAYVPFGDFESGQAALVDEASHDVQPSAPFLPDSPAGSQRERSSTTAGSDVDLHAGSADIDSPQNGVMLAGEAPTVQLAASDEHAQASNSSMHDAQPGAHVSSANARPAEHGGTGMQTPALLSGRSYAQRALVPQRTNSEMLVHHTANEQVQYILDGPFRDEDLRGKLIQVRDLAKRCHVILTKQFVSRHVCARSRMCTLFHCQYVTRTCSALWPASTCPIICVIDRNRSRLFLSISQWRSGSEQRDRQLSMRAQLNQQKQRSTQRTWSKRSSCRR